MSRCIQPNAIPRLRGRLCVCVPACVYLYLVCKVRSAMGAYNLSHFPPTLNTVPNRVLRVHPSRNTSHRKTLPGSAQKPVPHQGFEGHRSEQGEDYGVLHIHDTCGMGPSEALYLIGYAAELFLIHVFSMPPYVRVGTRCRHDVSRQCTKGNAKHSQRAKKY